MAEELLSSLGVAFIVIAIIITVTFRSLRMGLLSLPPNLLPLLISFGLMGVMGWSLEINSGFVFVVALGLAVDDTIHVLARVREGETRDGRRESFLEDSFVHAGEALVITTAVLIGGFGICALSAFPALHLLGCIGAAAIGTALVADVLVLPALLALFWKDGEGA